MSIEFGTNLDTLPEAAIADVRWLVELDHPVEGVLRYASGPASDGQPILWGDDSPTPAWPVANFVITGIGELRAPGRAGISITFNAMDFVALATFLQITRESSISVYVTRALLNYTGADDVVKVYDGKITGGYKIRPGRIEIESFVTTDLFPKKYVTPQNGFTSVLAPGVYQFGSDSLVVESAQ